MIPFLYIKISKEHQVVAWMNARQVVNSTTFFLQKLGKKQHLIRDWCCFVLRRIS